MTTTLSAAEPAAPPRQNPGPARRGRRQTALSRRTLLLFGGPFVVLFLAMYIAPIVYATVSSFYVVKRSGLGLTAPTKEFDPLHNFAQAFGDHDFLAGLGRVGLFAVVQVPLMLGVALGLALLIDAKSARGKGLFRLGAFLPYAIPGVSAALVWSFMYSADSSPINHLLEPLGIQIPFFSSGSVLWSVANIVTWSWTGYNMIIIYSALQTIPGEVLEAARMDGASALRIAWHIKIPAVRSSLVLTAVFSIIGSAQLFNEPTVLQPISSGSISSTFTPIMSAQAAVAAGNYHYAAAQSVILAVAVGVLSFVFFKLTNRSENA
ncbi:sugar ABC transporter permease [Streptomyces kanamyceticus]|uniref:Sugar ABC transporter permease n=2 Tax=Streptomyces kanamyceticus TaxID=1967 RepID=A0A5J6GPA8_STRKN|nr:sugar ABC transporter permease [Streptomyces kanamyceticus]QEU95941.1 sugar ABC transporter permease [Streptomyces kanamyceticus]